MAVQFIIDREGNDLGLYSGALEFLPDLSAENFTSYGHVNSVFEVPIPINDTDFSLDDSKDNLFNNTLIIQLDNFIKQVNVQGFRHYHAAHPSNFSRTFVNTSNYGSIMSMGKKDKKFDEIL